VDGQLPATWDKIFLTGWPVATNQPTNHKGRWGQLTKQEESKTVK
jgi:hypothetical protein